MTDMEPELIRLRATIAAAEAVIGDGDATLLHTCGVAVALGLRWTGVAYVTEYRSVFDGAPIARCEVCGEALDEYHL